MEVEITQLAIFVSVFAFLFFVPGYAIMRKKKIEADLIASAFVISSFIILIESLVLAAFALLNPAALVTVTAMTIGATLAYRSANP